MLSIVRLHFETSSPQKLLDQLKSSFMWKIYMYALREQKLYNCSWSHDQSGHHAHVRVLTRILKVGVQDSLFIKSRSPSQKVGVPFPKNRSPIFFQESPLIVSMSPVTSFYKYPMENQFPYFHILVCVCVCVCVFSTDFGICFMC